MRCRLAVRLFRDPTSGLAEHVLRVSGEPIAGGAKAIGSDEKTFQSYEDLVAFLQSLEVRNETIDKLSVVVEQPATAFRFVGFEEGEQITFDRLQVADLDLFQD